MVRTYLHTGMLLVSLGLAACGLQGGGKGDGGAGDGGTGDEGPSAPVDPTQGEWLEGFLLPGTNGQGAQVRAALRGPDGRLYVAGDFTQVGSTPARNVAAWNGAQWEPLDEGVPGFVNSLAFTADGTLYAGGWLKDNETPNSLMRWNGTRWERAGGELLGPVHELAAFGDGLLVGGAFSTERDLLPPEGLFYFDGTTLEHVGGPVVGEVGALDVLDAQRFCAGGVFSSAGGVPAKNVACWNGSVWSQLGDGLPGGVSVLVRDAAGRHIAGGTLTFLMGYEKEDSFAGLAVLHKGSWAPLAGGVDDGFINEVRAIAPHPDGGLLVGGHFLTAGKPFPVKASHIAWLDPHGQWSEVGGGVRNNVGVFLRWLEGIHALLVEPDGSVLMAGVFTTAGETVVANITRWDGAHYSPVLPRGVRTHGIAGSVSTLVEDAQGGLVIGGRFKGVGTLPVSNVAQRMGSESWNDMGGGLDAAVRALLRCKDGRLVAGGDFQHSGTTSVPHLARWSGTAWEAFTPPLDGPVHAIVEDSAGHLYVAGDFVMAGAVKVSRVARWDGTQWHPLRLGFGDGRVSALALDAAGHLYAGGTFTRTADQVEVHRLAKWDGLSWQPLAGGIEDPGGSVYRLTFDTEGHLLVGGRFSGIGGNPNIWSLARWDGSAFHPVGPQLKNKSSGEFLPAYIIDMVPHGPGLIVTGAFEFAGDLPLENLAWFDGEGFHPLGGGLSDLGQTLLLRDDSLFVGGPFMEAGGKPSVGVALWRTTP